MNGNSRSQGFEILFLAVAICLMIPALCVAIPDDSHTTNVHITLAELNVTNASLPDPSALPEYRITPEPIRAQVSLGETALPAPKGEMAAGPRTIGVSIDPVVLAAGIIAVIAIGIGVLYYTQRNREDNQE
jgi:hypothetical protein